MSVCQTCKKVFTYPSRLERHKNGKFPCKPSEQIYRGQLQDDSNENITQCKFCQKECGKNIKRHENTCQLGKDEVRLLEIKLGIPLKDSGKLTCNFCNKEYSRTDVLAHHEETCVNKQIYLANLKGQTIAEEIGKSVNVNVSFYNRKIHDRNIIIDM